MDAAHRMAQLVRQTEQGETIDVECWLALLRAQDRESGRIAQLATKLRLRTVFEFATLNSSAARLSRASPVISMFLARRRSKFQKAGNRRDVISGTARASRVPSAPAGRLTNTGSAKP